MGSPGVDELRWLAAAAGDDLTLISTRRGEGFPQPSRHGIVTFRGIVRNAAGEALCEMVSPILIGRRAGPLRLAG